MPRTILAVLLALTAMSAPAIVDPHDESDPQRCRSCHTQAIHDPDRREGEYHLLTASVDGVCLICHRKEECCRVGQEHLEKLFLGEHTHPSDLRVSRVGREHRPRTLPVHDGRITCNTCHLHDRGKPEDYKLVRLVISKRTGVDWTPLCHDCHDDY